MADDELLATYSGLGTRDGDKYYKGEECLACVKDLIRFLRDDELVSSRIRRHLGQARILQRDLIPILSNFHEDKVEEMCVILTLCFYYAVKTRKFQKYSSFILFSGAGVGYRNFSAV